MWVRRAPPGSSALRPSAVGDRRVRCRSCGRRARLRVSGAWSFRRLRAVRAVAFALGCCLRSRNGRRDVSGCAAADASSPSALPRPARVAFPLASFAPLESRGRRWFPLSTLNRACGFVAARGGLMRVRRRVRAGARGDGAGRMRLGRRGCRLSLRIVGKRLPAAVPPLVLPSAPAGPPPLRRRIHFPVGVPRQRRPGGVTDAPGRSWAFSAGRRPARAGPAVTAGRQGACALRASALLDPAVPIYARPAPAGRPGGQSVPCRRALCTRSSCSSKSRV